MMNIAFTPDNNYVMPTTVALTSLFLNNKGHEITIYILYLSGDLSQENQEKIQTVVEEYGQSVHFCEIDKNVMAAFPKLRHGLSAYIRILTPNLLPNVDKLLYLDGDIVVESDLSDLFNIDISDYCMAAVSDLKQLFNPASMKAIGFKYKREYFNSGVLLMNLPVLRKMDLMDKTLNYLAGYKDKIYNEDQDILNCICPNVLLLPPKYNSIIHLWNRNLPLCKKVWTDDEILDARRRPAIIHYLGGFKPWKYEVYHPFKRRWYYYLRRTCYKKFRPSYTFRKILSKIKSYFLNGLIYKLR